VGHVVTAVTVNRVDGNVDLLPLIYLFFLLYLSGIVKCGQCGAAMHVTYPVIEPKIRFKYYVCNNRYNHRNCDQAYIRADILEHSVIQEIEKLPVRKDVVFASVKDYIDHNHNTLLLKLEDKNQRASKDLESIRSERGETEQMAFECRSHLPGSAFLEPTGRSSRGGGEQDPGASLGNRARNQCYPGKIL